ncbi:protein wings apart-like [Polistes fuscatus]|uniref:protein wings apart-like n=1 Tax=Polistes fuscatus TaxID=30207 RepID=UPI001CA97222|nr:protein wings apart-like [Polistes fuscatus]XP_043498319.1 protein wings apart-like [Polistes fuscatus]XP_043498320.1 protein wings apart-like [Polistes fuscatus]XP_043498321.1 protein wings apart-like [Polistes fuscatus]
MTSRSYTKSYSRKVSSVTPGSIQFDKLFRENSNRPSAAKSAGTVGKWGITSFTSIRSTNINGRRDNIHNSFGAKRMKIDYSNQNARVSSGKDPFSFEIDPASKTETTQAVAKPKKFFKSRNVPPVVEESRQDVAIYKQVPDSQYGRARAQKQPQQSLPKQPLPKPMHTPAKKVSEIIDNTGNEISNREEGKPPIVLRICKGTARLVCGDVQNNQDPEPETYRISTPLTSPTKIDIERKSNIEPSIKTDLKTTRSQQPIVSTVSIPLENSDMRRTTRSRAKNLHLDITGSSAVTTASTTSNTHSSGLSLTLRKSVTDFSNNTLISHYDIVKTDCSSTYPCKPTIEPLIGRDQPLPTTTQELIDILSSDADPMQTRPMILNVPEVEDNTEITSDEVQHCSIDLPTNEVIPETNRQLEKETEAEIEQELEPEAETEAEPDPEVELESSAHVADSETAAAKTLVDQDWFSGSDDSEGVSGNVENEMPLHVTSTVSESQTLNTPATNAPSKPVTKKGSIFKSRSTGTTNGNKRRALYKHKWCDSDKESSTTDAPNIGNVIPTTASGSHSAVGSEAYAGEFEPSQLTRVVTYPETDVDFTDDSEAVTSVRCCRKVKGFYTVVKNVKKAHQIQESGEFQEFNDDVEYILDTLRENNPNATRCLSAIRLASKCMAPAFRMHVRAHGTVAKFFKALHDATKDQSLGLCTATVMFVLSQDRLAMDLDRDCLELMLSLLESDASHKDALDDCGLSRAELLKNKEKVRQLCADIQAQGHAKHLNLDNITVGQLAMETLLSLTSKRAGEWFKEELRELGGLEHIIKTIRECHRHINVHDVTRARWTEPLLDKLRKVDRCLRVLENVTHMNEENQVYLLKYGDGVLVSTLASLYNLCRQEIPIYPTTDTSDKSSTGAVVRECLFAIIKVLINLTHRFNRQSSGSKLVGSQSGVVDCTLYLLLRVPESLPEEKRFDMMMLALILLINLVEQCDDNKQLLIESKAPPSTENIFDAEESGVESLIDLFYKQEELARAEEQKTDAILDGKKDSEQTETVSTTTKSQEEFIEETVTKLLQKAGRHMEHTLIGAYVVLLLGYLIMDNKDYESLVRSRLPDNNFSTMVSVLQKFFNFMNLTASNEVSSCGIAATEKVIKFLKMSDVRTEEERNELPLPALEDPNMMLDLTS